MLRVSPVQRDHLTHGQTGHLHRPPRHRHGDRHHTGHTLSHGYQEKAVQRLEVELFYLLFISVRQCVDTFQGGVLPRVGVGGAPGGLQHHHQPAGPAVPLSPRQPPLSGHGQDPDVTSPSPSLVFSVC